jgi:HK97 family phage major capsid protein
MTSLIVEAVNEVSAAFDCFKKTHDTRLAEMQDRIEQIEAKRNSPSMARGTISPENQGEAIREGVGLLAKGMGLKEDGYIAKGNELLGKCAGGLPLRDGPKFVTIGEGKAADSLTGAAGGNTVPIVIGDEIFRMVRQRSRIVDLVRRTNTDTKPSSYRRVVSGIGTNSGWINETGTRSETNTPVMNVTAPTEGMLYSYPKITEELLASSAFNLGEFLLSEIARDFAVALGAAVISGNGSSRPTGLLNSAPVVTADASRAFGTLQYIPSGAASTLHATTPLNAFWDMVTTLNGDYRSNARWVMNSATLGALAKLNDTTNRPLLQPPMVAGLPPTLLGYEVVVDEQVASIGANNFPVLFGDFNVGYELISNFEARITRDEISQPGYVKFYSRSYVGGITADSNAVKALKIAST